eukprot:2915423-Alexandrium_andersonii.AAC.1
MGPSRDLPCHFHAAEVFGFQLVDAARLGLRSATRSLPGLSLPEEVFQLLFPGAKSLGLSW